MPASSGASTVVNYYWEDNGFNQDPTDDSPKLFGADAQLATNEATRNGTRITLPASHRTIDVEPGTFDGAWALEGSLTNPWWIRAILGSPSTTDNGDGTYTHVWDGTPDPLRIVEGYEDFGAERTLMGCVAQTASVDPTVDGNTVDITLEGFYAEEDTETNVSVTSQTGLSMDTLGYEDASLTVDGTERMIIQNASWSFETGAESIPGFGSSFPIDYYVGLMEPTLDYSAIKMDTSAQESVYGGSTTMESDVTKENVTLAFDNGDSNQLDIINEGAFPESYGEDGVGNPQDVLQENLNYILTDSRVEATNDVATAP